MALKITRYAPLEGNSNTGYSVPIFFGKGAGARSHLMSVDFNGDPQTTEPLPLFSPQEPGTVLGQLWICKGTVLRVEGAEFIPPAELLLRIKHAALAEEKELKRIQRQVEAFENVQAAAGARRERIPEDMKLFVWQRDEGKCVRCGSNERLEFDHIIPVAEGGANTARNIQLLCELCNRQKGKSI